MNFVSAFRSSAPYINAHRGETFVIQFGTWLLESDLATGFVHDLVLLHALGIRLVLVPGAKTHIDARLDSLNLPFTHLGARRITDQRTMEVVKAVNGELRVDIEARLSVGLANSPSAGARIGVRSGNYVTARPVGIVDGKDLMYTGEVRRIDGLGLNTSLSAGNIVLLTPLGYSPTGEVFNLTAEEVASAVAIELKAAKLFLLGKEGGIQDSGGALVRELGMAEASALLRQRADTDALSTADSTRQLTTALRACQGGVTRTHLIDAEVDGGIVLEAFTRDGIGTMVYADPYEVIRQADEDDVSGILGLIEPLENQGVLVRRSRDKLEQELGSFTVIERDGTVVACAAMYTSDDASHAELACLAVDPAYRKGERGERLLARIEQQARRGGATTLFVLTTRTAQWFMEHGFVAGNVEDLPVSRQAMYNFQRNSRVLLKHL